MSKADTLGAAPAFGAARTARSSRRNAIDRTTGGDAAAAAAVTELPVTVISENPDNPRNHLRNLEETVESVRSVGVILPIVVGTVEAYLHGRPDRAGDLEDGTQYVVIDGHRRLEASRRVGLATIPVRVDNARLATDEALLEAAFIANYHRDDMTDLEEAHALKQLVDYYGSQTKASKRLGIPQPTLSSKLSLLKLTPELQKDLMAGERTAEHVRNLSKLPPDEQKKKADERRKAARRKAEQTRQETAGRATAGGASAGTADYHAVISHGTVTPSGGESAPTTQADDTPEPATGQNTPPADLETPQPEQDSPATATEQPATATVSVPGQSTPADATDGAAGAVRLEYDKPGWLAMLLDKKIADDDVFFELWRLLGGKAYERNPDRAVQHARSLLEELTDRPA